MIQKNPRAYGSLSLHTPAYYTITSIQPPIINRIAIVDFLDLTLLKDVIYVNIALGMSFALYSDVMFFTIQPLYLFQLEFTKVSSNHVPIYIYIKLNVSVWGVCVCLCFSERYNSETIRPIEFYSKCISGMGRFQA